MNEEILKNAILSKYKQNNLIKDTSYEFNFNNVQVQKKDEAQVFLNGAITCSVFYNEYSPVYNRESYFSYDNGKEVLYVTKTPIIPADAFECHMSIYDEENGGFALNIFLNGKYHFTERTNIVEDYILQDNVAGLDRLFEDNNFELFEEMECMYSISPSKDKIFKTFTEFEKEIKILIEKLGMEYDKTAEEYSYEELEFESKKNFLKFIKKLSKEDLNNFLRNEFEE